MAAINLAEIPREAYALIGTVLGAVIALTGVIFTNIVGPRAARRIEEAKLQAAREDALHKDLGLRIVQLTSDLASAVHSMAWLTWSSNRDALTRPKIDSYDTELHAVLPKISGDVVSVTALNDDLGRLARQMRDYVYRLDFEIGEACLSFEKDPNHTEALLRDLTPKSP